MAVVGKSILGNDLDNENTKLSFPLEMLYKVVHGEALLRFKLNPNERYTIWHGRVLAYGDRVLEALDVYTEGLKKFPDSYRIYRHRGHRYLTLHRVQDALADFKKGVELFEKAGAPVSEMEEDGVRHRLPIPPETTGFNLYYHAAVAAYLCDELEYAREMNEKTFRYCINDEDIVAASDWGYLILLRMGREEEANALIAKVADDLVIKDNVGYYKRIKYYKGQLSYEEMQVIQLKDSDAYHRPLARISQLYGVAAYDICHGSRERAEALLDEMIAANKQFGAFAHLAAEHDLKALREGKL